MTITFLEGMKTVLRRSWWWITGLLVCYAMHKDGDAFCKRRAGHLGKHSTAGGFKW